MVVRLLPADSGDGISFRRIDLPPGPLVRAVIDNVIDTVRTTTVAVQDRRVAGVEHLLSACAGLGVTDLMVELSAEELPVLDGSARPWAEALQVAAPLQTHGRVEVRVPSAVHTSERVRWEPPADGDDGSSLELHVCHHPGRGLASQQRVFRVGPQQFLAEIAPARTFAFVDEVASLRAGGLGLGGSLENTLVLDETGAAINAGGMRMEGEPVRHKALDALGDLALLDGVRLAGRLFLDGAGHRHHVGFLRSLATTNRRA